MMPKTALRIGPQDHGRAMSLDEFDAAEGAPGKVYELGRGVVSVTDVPGRLHLAQFLATRSQLLEYQARHKDRIHAILGGQECKMLIQGVESERHPDLSVYATPPPDEEDIWSLWVPLLVVEIVSKGSQRRDYNEKREDYLLFGIQEYWILDREKHRMTALRRWRGQWREKIVHAPEMYRTPLLSGLKFDCGAVFDAK